MEFWHFVVLVLIAILLVLYTNYKCKKNLVKRLNICPCPQMYTPIFHDRLKLSISLYSKDTEPLEVMCILVDKETWKSLSLNQCDAILTFWAKGMWKERTFWCWKNA